MPDLNTPAGTMGVSKVRGRLPPACLPLTLTGVPYACMSPTNERLWNAD